MSARANRGFLARAARFLAAEAGIGQFLDIGTGIPTVSNTHEVARRVAPASRIVYVYVSPGGPRPHLLTTGLIAAAWV